MSEQIDVLDHGYVRLVDHMGSDLSVVRAARVSYDADWRAGEDHGSDARLISYLWKNKHTTPFEAVQFAFEISAPIFVFRQWHRHRTWSFNEVSARYTELPEMFYVPDPKVLGVQSTSSKQARVIGAVTDEGNAAQEIGLYTRHCQQSFSVYRELLRSEWPRELARMVLPLSTYSRMHASIDMLNLFKFLTLRCHEHAQYEIRVYAEAMLTLIEPIVPVSVKAWRDNRG